jgi:hypothetical protein
MTTNDFMSAGGVQSALFHNIGDTVVGHIFSPPEKRQQIDINTKQPAVYPDGNPKMQWKVILMTELNEGDDDDGLRAIYMPVNKNMHRAVVDAVRKAGAQSLEVGGKLGVRYEGDGEQLRRGFSPPKIYSARYQPPAPAVSDDFLTPEDQADLAVATNGASRQAPPAQQRRAPVAAPLPDEIPF